MSIQTTCPYCGVGCGLLADGDGTISGDPLHPANFGRLCSKGAALGDTLALDGRLHEPMIHRQPATWDEALDLIARRFSQAVAEHGPDAVALYVSGQLLSEDYYVANKLMKGFVGSANIDSNSRLCMASSVAGHIRAFGEDVVPGCYEDIDETDLAVLVGSNTAWCHPVLFQRLAAARQTRGTRVVVIDPRRTASCEIADLHLALRPGADAALFAGLLRYLSDHGMCNNDWITGRTTGFDAALSIAPSLAEAAAITDLPADELARFYEWFAGTQRAVTLYSQGVNQSSSGTDKVNAIINCHLATGRLGRPGMGPFSLTGQPNAMGGREVGGLANQLAAHMNFSASADIDRVRRFWGAPHMAARPGLKAVDLFEAVCAGRIKALWILGTNPAASVPRAQQVRAGLARCPFVVVSDCWPTDTTALADVVLPAAGWGEKDGTVTNSERRISRQRAFRLPPGAARPDWWMLTEVARRMGWGDAFSYQRSSDIFREHAALSAFENDGAGRRMFDIGGLAALSDADYDRLEPVQWPVPRTCERRRADSPRLFASDGGRFATEDGRAHFVPTRWLPPVERPDEDWPLLLNTGRLRDQWHTMTRTGEVPRLMRHQDEPVLTLHPVDGRRYGVSDGALVRIESRHGATLIRVMLSAEQRPGEVFAPMHWTDRFSSTGPVDRLVSAATDPISGQPELKATVVRLSAVPVLWWGLLLRRSELAMPADMYWSRVPIEAGHAFTLAGREELPGGSRLDDWVDSLLTRPARSELISYSDAGRGVFRYASLVDGRLDACLFVDAHRTSLPGREGLAGRLGAAVEGAGRIGLLAGAAAGGPSTAAERIVCTCFAVGLDVLQRAIADRGMTSVADIGAALRAGTNCGSCIPELNAILREVQPDESTPA
ncbi:MAG: molybdopterin-dependent oxidoreductase [Alphaproteobacteria bacterium]|nr:molybdopterin-dependent oxidoreductase [Alphaproteobacteria bacterium]